MRESKYSKEMGATAACTVCLAELTYQLEEIEDGNLKQLVKGNEWFGSVALAPNCRRGGNSNPQSEN